MVACPGCAQDRRLAGPGTKTCGPAVYGLRPVWALAAISAILSGLSACPASALAPGSRPVLGPAPPDDQDPDL